MFFATCSVAGMVARVVGLDVLDHR